MSLKYGISLILGFLLTLTSPKITIGSIPITFILPFIFGFFLLLWQKYRLNRDIVYFSISIFAALFISSIISLLISFFGEAYSISIKSVLLFLYSIVLFAIFSTAAFYIMKKNFKYIWGILLFILIFFSVIEVLNPEVFYSIRSTLYPEEIQADFRLRDSTHMFGPRPMLLFNEPSHLAKFFAIIWILYAFSNKFEIKALILFFLIFLLLRSPTFLIVLPLFIFFLKKELSVLQKVFLSLLLVIILFILGLAIEYRLSYSLEEGSGSLQERILFPILYLYREWEYFFGFPLGAHQDMYYKICENMAYTRPTWDCSDNPSVASASALVFIGNIGLVGAIVFGGLLIFKYKLFGVFLFLMFIGAQLFTTGFNTPGNYIILGFLVAGAFYYRERRRQDA